MPLPSKDMRRLLLCALLASPLFGGQSLPGGRPDSDTSYIDPDGTAHITRVVPVPKSISPEAQKKLARQVSDEKKPETIESRRASTDKWQNGAGEAFRKQYGATVEEKTMAGVPVRVITPSTIAPNRTDCVLINLHGGGFNADSGSLTETIPVASLAKTKVIAVLYRLAPEHPFPAAVDDVLAVYKELLKSYRPEKIGLFGTSAGAVLTAEAAVRFKQLALPLPAALGIFSGFGDFSVPGDTRAIFALNGFSGPMTEMDKKQTADSPYTKGTDLKDPVLSPTYADVQSFPPTLFVSSTRDSLLSGTVLLHRQFLRAGVEAQLVVFEALPHAFWNDNGLPESREAHEIMAKFLSEHLASAKQLTKSAAARQATATQHE